ncbi:MAG TPA: HlyD family efflux transporter periplasmic adaptor subunit [Puia sp.]|jgi:multidrug efflux pump subunit AcrA (membrane-fusion protein)|nr:HlyD family efflux transporter periplasmic adaptor subunit [Puia sp.]
MKKSYPYLFLFLVVLEACTSKPEGKEDIATIVQTPVTLTGIEKEPMAEFIELNATSSFLLKNYVKANANGYIETAHVTPGEYVRSGEVLFTMKTKEAESIGNAINQLDTSFKFSGTNNIRAGSGGFISQLNHQPGDYVQDGEQLAVISDESSFVFLLELPYELKPYVKLNTRIDVQLPDGEKLPGTVSSYMPTVEAASQTISLVIKVDPGKKIPENLIAKVKIQKIIRDHAVSLPKASVLADETQSSFWVMKLIDSTTAIKVPVTKGIETKDMVEILSPQFTTEDRFVLTGNYGLGDTAKIKIVQP